MADIIRKTGADGRTAYELAVDSGFEGTLEDWLALLYRAPLAIPVLGALTAGELVCRADLPDVVWVDTDRDVSTFDAAATGLSVFTISVDEVTVGTVNIGAGQTVATFAWLTTSFGPGVLRVRAPNPADATLRDGSITVVLKTFAPA